MIAAVRSKHEEPVFRALLFLINLFPSRLITFLGAPSCLLWLVYNAVASVEILPRMDKHLKHQA